MSSIGRKRKLKMPPPQMDISEQLEKISWCNSEWSSPETKKKSIQKLLQQCTDLPSAELVSDVQDIITRSENFPIEFPVQTVRLKELKQRKPEVRLNRNIISTYPLIHERVLVLMAQFLKYKREYGSAIEKALYKGMTIPQFVDRLLKKRSVAFLTATDKYKLLTGERGADGWESVGTSNEKPPLILENCLSYDEMKISAMLYVSGYTECINDGARKNCGVVQEDDIEQEAVIIGVIGARFKRIGRMEYEDILITKEQNTVDKGYGQLTDNAKSQWRKLWTDFYESSNHTYDELPSMDIQTRRPDDKFLDRFVDIGKDVVFDNQVFYRRMVILIETTLWEAERRGAESGRTVFLNIIGAGLGVWKASKHQEDVFVLSFIERTRALMAAGQLDHITDMNFAYIRPGNKVKALFKKASKPTEGSLLEYQMFLKCDKHPNGGINVQLESREPTSKLKGEHAGKLLVITYPWDGNAHPGNEFWIGKLHSSGDPAAACSTQVAELHNAHINPAVCGHNVRVASRSGVTTLKDSCLALTA